MVSDSIDKRLYKLLKIFVLRNSNSGSEYQAWNELKIWRYRSCRAQSEMSNNRFSIINKGYYYDRETEVKRGGKTEQEIEWRAKIE